MVEQALVSGSFFGGSQKPTEAKQSHALFSAGQHDGHFFPGVYTGFSPSLQKPSCAKHSHVLSGVSSRPLPGQQASSHLQGTVLQSGHNFWQRLCVGKWAAESTQRLAIRRARIMLVSRRMAELAWKS